VADDTNQGPDARDATAVTDELDATDAADATDAIEAAYQRGNQAYVADDIEGARLAWEEAVRLLGPGDDARAADLYENLGIAYWRQQRWRPAIRAFLRVLDGDPGAREQTLRLLVSCLFRDGLPHDGAHYLAEYESRFGAHPAGWRRNDPETP